MHLGERTNTAMVLPLLLLGLAGCGDDQLATYEPITDPAELYMSLTLDHRAVTMAAVPSYNTLQLQATPRDALGQPIEGLPAPTFRTLILGDTLNLRVSPEGLLTALQPATNVMVVAELTAPGNVRHADTAIVTVTEPPTASFDAIQMEVTAPDSALWSVPPVDSRKGFGAPPVRALPILWYNFFGTNQDAQFDLAPRVHAWDAAQNPITGLVVEYRSLDPDIAGPAPVTDRPAWSLSRMQAFRAGRARFVAQATAYGITKADTFTFTVTPPTIISIPIGGVPGAASIFGLDRTIRTNGIVLWMNSLDRPVDLVFDNPADVLPAPAQVCDAAVVIAAFLMKIPGAGPFCSTGGNITIPLPESAADQKAIVKTTRMQQFPHAGIYTYHDALTGASGRIIVTDVAE